MKCGIRTTEFYTAIFATFLAAVLLILSFSQGWEMTAGLLSTTLSPCLAYIGGRSAIKAMQKNDSDSA